MVSDCIDTLCIQVFALWYAAIHGLGIHSHSLRAGEIACALCWPMSHLQYLQLLLCNNQGSRVDVHVQETHAAGCFACVTYQSESLCCSALASCYVSS